MRQPANFVVAYELDGAEGPHCLTLAGGSGVVLSLKLGGFPPIFFCYSGGIESYTIVIYSLFSRALLKGGPLYSIGFPPKFRGTLEGI